MVFAIPYVVSFEEIERSFLLTMSTIAQVFYVFAVIFGGYISDKVGRRVPMLIGSTLLAVWGFVFFPLMFSGTAAGTLAAFAVTLLGIGLTVGPMAAFLAELFDTGVRYSGLSVGYQFSAALSGGLSPVVATYLTYEFGTWVPVAIVVAIALGFSAIAILLSTDRSRSPLN
jgi:MFS family permease